MIQDSNNKKSTKISSLWMAMAILLGVFSSWGQAIDLLAQQQPLEKTEWLESFQFGKKEHSISLEKATKPVYKDSPIFTVKRIGIHELKTQHQQHQKTAFQVCLKQALAFSPTAYFLIQNNALQNSEDEALLYII